MLLLLHLANGDFHVQPNVLLIVIPLLTLALLAAVVVWLIRWSSRSPRANATLSDAKGNQLDRHRRR
jgi:hypothetical protein